MLTKISLKKKKSSSLPKSDNAKILKISKPPLKKETKLGSVYIRCTKRNIFCTLVDPLSKKVRTSCSLQVPQYKNEYNERENPYTRGLLLGSLLAERTISLGYNKLVIYLVGTSAGRLGVVRSLGKSDINIHSIVLATCMPHNGCRPAKVRRKKYRTKVKGFK